MTPILIIVVVVIVLLVLWWLLSRRRETPAARIEPTLPPVKTEPPAWAAKADVAASAPSVKPGVPTQAAEVKPAPAAARVEPTLATVRTELPAQAPKVEIPVVPAPAPVAEVKPSVAAPVAKVAEVATPPLSVGAPAPAAEVAAPPAAAPEPPKPDDLTIIEGIGPKISALLRAAGITTFAQLAATDVARLREIMLQVNLRIADPTTWPEQAALAAANKWDDLKALQGSLKGGRRV